MNGKIAARIQELALSAAREFKGPGRQLVDPARAAALGELPDASGEDVGAAIGRASDAFRSGRWSRLSADERGACLIQAAEAIRQHANVFSMLDSLNVGKPIAQARDEPDVVAGFFDSCGRIVSAMSDEIIQSTDEQVTMVVREPLGVVAAIVPWNYPLPIAAASITGPLAAGNSVVLKPSPETPLSALHMAEVLRQHLPDGVLEVVTGGAQVGRQLVEDPRVRKINFTGSTGTGFEIMQAAAASFKRLGLELGGKSPTLIFADAPLDLAVDSALRRLTANQGENCAAGSRLLIEESVYDDVLQALIGAARQLKVGDPQDEITDLGPMISAEHRDRVSGYVSRADKEASQVYVGSVPSEPPLDKGYFVPISIYETPSTAELWRDEVFGPVLSVTQFKGEEQAAELANDTQYGLMAHIWCGDRGRAVRVARRLEAGIVRVNRGLEPIHGPWGGFKSSGIGRNWGRYGIEASSELKQICLDIRAYGPA